VGAAHAIITQFGQQQKWSPVTSTGINQFAEAGLLCSLLSILVITIPVMEP